MSKAMTSGRVLFVACVAALGGILFGYDTAVISGTTRIVADQFALTEMSKGWYVGCALIGSILGVSVAGMLSDFLGRKKTMLISALMFSISAIGCAVCADFTQLVIYRIIGGFGIGVVSIVSPVYISEVSPAEKRGTMVSLYQLAVTIGFLLAYLMNYLVLKGADTASTDPALGTRMFNNEYWRGMLGLETIPDLLFLVLIFFIPESPRWLAVRGERKDNSEEWKALREPGILKAVLVGSAIAILGQFMGVNAVLYYGPEIFQDAGLSSEGSMFSTVLVGVVNMVTTVIALLIIDKVGRKQLVWWGVGGMILCLVAIGTYFAWGPQLGLGTGFLLTFFLLYVFCTAIHLHQRRGVRPPVRDVPEPRPRPGDVHRRPRPVGRHLPHRPAHALDAGESHPGRHVLPIRLLLPPLPVHHVEVHPGDHRQDAGGNRGLLEEVIGFPPKS